MGIQNSVADFRDLARKRIPRALFEYADRGSYDEVTLRRNREDLARLSFRQRVMVDLSALSLATSVLGAAWSCPVAIAPTALAGLFHRDGEIQGARAAAAFGVPFTLSTMSICSIEDVRAASDVPFWFQLYLMRDRGFNAELIARAKAANCAALMLTLDLPMLALRRRDPKNGLSIPPRLTWQNALDIATKPRWAASVLFGKRRTFGNLETQLAKIAPAGSRSGVQTLAAWTHTQFDRSCTWDDIAWVRERWPGPLVVKGILDSEDARKAVAAGVDALVVSNHGGRQLDGAPSSIAALPGIVAAVDGRCEVLFDGGVQSGQDVLRALALGARACLVGKSFLYALAAGGESGVTRMLTLLADELRVSMALTGCTDVRRVSREVLIDGLDRSA